MDSLAVQLSRKVLGEHASDVVDGVRRGKSNEKIHELMGHATVESELST